MQARHVSPPLLTLLSLLALAHCGSSSEDVARPPLAPFADAAPRDGAPPVDPPDGGAAADAGARLASMSIARSIFPAVSGKDGRIRTFGGLGTLGLTDTTEAYDATANTWTKGTGRSSVSRYGHAATEDASGAIYVVGGTVDGTSPIGAAEVFAPATGAFTAIADLPTPRLGLGLATGKDGKIYAIGGREAAGGASGVVEIYAPETKTWSPGPSLPTKRLALVAVASADGRIYAIGGRDAANAPLGTVEVLDTASGTWSAAPSLGAARFWLGAARGADGKIYALGGVGNAGFTDAAEALAPGAAAWVDLPALPEPRAWLGVGASADGRIFAIGGGTPGDDLPSAQPPPLRTMLGFDPKSRTWTK